MQIDRFHWQSEEAFHRIKAGKPVVLQECPLICPHYAQWAPDLIAEYINEDFLCDAFVTKNKRFLYSEESKNAYNYSCPGGAHKIQITFRECMAKIRASSEGQEASEYYYLQNSLYAEMGPRLLEEYMNFSLQTAVLYKVLGGWQELTRNLLLYGQEGFVTPLHFDEQENIFCQLYGRKRARLLSPAHWHTVYPYPNGHPCDRQCQVTLSAQPGTLQGVSEEHLNLFPAFRHMPEHEYCADLEAGDVLYVPQYWFHQLEGLGENISLSWWFKHKKNTDSLDISTLYIVLDDVSIVTIRRNIEKVIATMVGSGRNAHEYFLALASGRIELPGLDAAATEEDQGLSPYFVQKQVLKADSDAATTKLNDLEGKEELWKEVTKKAVEMLSLLIKPEYASGFLLQTVSGRFHAF